MVCGSDSSSGLNVAKNAWETVQVARHPMRPHALDYIRCFDDFDELHGDRMYGDCRAIVGGTATFADMSVMVIGQEKGHDLESRLEHNFGMPLPEGYRKASRLYKLAERYQMPLILFLDSPGAFAGVEAEKRNQSEAIASNIVQMTGLKVPIIVYVIGEAMSGGAMAMGVSDYTAMLSNSVYSVISPEGCSGILWKDKLHMQEASEQMAVTAPSLLSHGFIDAIITEPEGGAHLDKRQTIRTVLTDLSKRLKELLLIDVDVLVQKRQDRFLKMGSHSLNE